MGMFDSLYDTEGREWQTKAFDRDLDCYEIGDVIPADCAATFQVEILHAPGTRLVESLGYSLATVRRGVLTEINVRRDVRLPLLDYSGRLTAAPNEHADRVTESKES